MSHNHEVRVIPVGKGGGWYVVKQGTRHCGLVRGMAQAIARADEVREANESIPARNPDLIYHHYLKHIKHEGNA